LTLLAAVAARTSRLKLGCTSYLLPIRNPLQAAEEVAVLDRLSGGRLILGLGRGMQPAMFRAFGVEPAAKRKLFAANLEVMRRAWRGEPVAEEEGRPLRLAPLPLQQPSPPLWVAAFGPLALKQVAALGLPYLASPIEPLAALEDNYRLHREAVAEAGLPAVSVVPVMRAVFVAEGARARAVREGLLRTLPPRLRDGAADTRDWSIVGDQVYVRDRLQECTERLGLTHLILRGGIPGCDVAYQRDSHAAVVQTVADL
jgi:alkanesulfonate monooxygenase SsuD/methylene tetrahydromethanopterin reductase-like flavin-dependent oxidoreductase (luciferase family)